VTAISPNNDVSIKAFTGQIERDNVCVPEKSEMMGQVFWAGRVASNTANGRYQYGITMELDGRQMQFDPYLDVQKN
ncbi:MAG: hypothetical protein AAF570_25810, partial [Bacteroidota bacterium]